MDATNLYDVWLVNEETHDKMRLRVEAGSTVGAQVKAVHDAHRKRHWGRCRTLSVDEVPHDE